MKKSIVTIVLTIIASLSNMAFAQDVGAVLRYQREHPNAAIIHKYEGMIDGFTEALGMECEDQVTEKFHIYFLVYQTPQYYACMRKPLMDMLAELQVSPSRIDDIVSSSKDAFDANWELEKEIRAQVEERQGELQDSLGVKCDSGLISFGAYSGSGPELASLNCKYQILNALVDLVAP